MAVLAGRQPVLPPRTSSPGSIPSNGASPSSSALTSQILGELGASSSPASASRRSPQKRKWNADHGEAPRASTFKKPSPHRFRNSTRSPIDPAATDNLALLTVQAQKGLSEVGLGVPRPLKAVAEASYKDAQETKELPAVPQSRVTQVGRKAPKRLDSVDVQIRRETGLASGGGANPKRYNTRSAGANLGKPQDGSGNVERRSRRSPQAAGQSGQPASVGRAETTPSLSSRMDEAEDEGPERSAGDLGLAHQSEGDANEDEEAAQEVQQQARVGEDEQDWQTSPENSPSAEDGSADERELRDAEAVSSKERHQTREGAGLADDDESRESETNEAQGTQQDDEQEEMDDTNSKGALSSPEHSGASEDKDDSDDDLPVFEYNDNDSTDEDHDVDPDAKDPALWREDGRIRGMMRRLGQGLNPDVVAQTPSAIKLVRMIAGAKDIYQGSIEFVHARLTGIKWRVKALLEHLAEQSSRARTKKLLSDLYAQIIPQLLLLFYAGWRFYRRRNGTAIDGLQVLLTMAKLALRCCTAARAARWQPLRQGIIGPIRELIGPLRRLKNVLREIAEERVRKEMARLARKRLEEARLRDIELAEQQRLENQRRIAERDKDAQEAIRLLKARFCLAPYHAASTQPGHSSQQGRPLHELDTAPSSQPQQPSSNGRRVEPSRSPNAPAAHLRPWSDQEVDALIEGLERYTGRNRYVTIIQKYGGPTGALEYRDMDELIKRAKELRADYFADYEAHPGRKGPPPWLDSI